MALRRGLFVRKDKQAGTSPADARMALAGLFSANGEISARPGVLPAPGNTPLVAGTSGWEYIVAARHFVLSRGAADGVTLAVNDGPVSVATTPAPQTGSRYDVVWVRHQDADSPWNDSSSEPEFGVTSGTATGTPSIPADATLPKGALRLANILVKAGATATLSPLVVVTIVAPATGTRGARLVVRNETERDLLSLAASPTNPIEVMRGDTGDIEWSIGSGWRSVAGGPRFGSLSHRNGWRDYGHPGAPARAHRDGAWVILEGLLAPGTISPDIQMSLISPGFRPAVRGYFPASAGNSYSGIVIIDTDGSILLRFPVTASVHYIGLDGIIFRAAQ